MKGILSVILVMLLGSQTSASKTAGQTAIDSVYLNPTRIIISAKTNVEPTPAEKEWALNLLSDLGLDGGSNLEKAKIIMNYIHSNYRYRIKSPRTITGFIDTDGGNCVSHTMTGLYLLRLAGIPAKLCYEIHIKNWMIVDGWRAGVKKAGYYGAGHNSHYWVLFFDGKEWQPYDSALGICGFDQFFSVRTATQRWPYFLSFNPGRMTGAPFIIQEETGSGSSGMINITASLWNREFDWKNSKVTKQEWFDFLENFSGLNTKDFTYPLDDPLRRDIRRLSKKWF